ncbi:MAG: NADP-dependent malic enzyme [Deltaproteobacteria bacterium]|nr:MAG: NADP-dependent malic enzyme [Deltaproteobacteria bacterium]
MDFTKKDALDYHAKGRPGKIEVVATKPSATQLDLSLAYTPGVAEPCREIADNPEAVYDYTVKGNLVAVVTDGSAVLGLGNIGPLAGKPVMEGKGILFKRFADIDVFDVELDSQDPEVVIQTVKLLEPTFGGISLEDIKAPECFYIEEQLVEQMDIPVFHDDQHGTAIIAGAAFLNGVEIVEKNIADVKVVFSGAGAAAIACARILVELGATQDNIIMCDSHGVIYKGRSEGMNPYKEQFAVDTNKRTLAEAMDGADAFLGLSVAGLVTQDMVKSMASDPLIFAMANPEPEILPEDVTAVRSDAILATGRSDYPNQVSNVLGFPFIFRGALDVRAAKINEAMKVAATRALADLAKEEVPDDVLVAYGMRDISFGREYIIPKPFDSRVLYRVAPAVAKAAMESGVARKPIDDFLAYQELLERRLHPTREVVQRFVTQARRGEKMRIVFPEGDHEKILRAVGTIVEMGIAHPILLGDPDGIKAKLDQLGVSLPESKYEVVSSWDAGDIPSEYINKYLEIRERKGVTHEGAVQQLQHRINYALMMVKLGDADGVVSGISRTYSETIKPALQLMGLQEGVRKACGMYLVLDKQGKVRFFADTTVNINPDAKDLASIAVSTSDLIKRLGITPRVAMLSFSNFGTARNPESNKVQEATALAKEMRPDLMIDGEMRVDVAVEPGRYMEDFPFNELKEEANVFIFPSLNAGNISYQMMQYLGGMEVVGPILIGINEPVNVLPRNCDIATVVSMSAITAVMAKRQRESSL